MPAPDGLATSIIVVDDNPVIRELLVDLLSLDGHHVIAASSGHEALNVLRSDQPIRILLTDLDMPGMSGWQLAAEARALRPALKIGIVTGTPDYQPHLRVPVDAIVLKPFTLDGLRQAVQAMSGAA